MSPERFQEITRRYGALRLAVLGDFCLDRYLEIDPSREEISIETGLPVYNVVHVRSQPGGAGTILNNLSALGVGEIHPIGFAGRDGEGFELEQALRDRPGVRAEGFIQTPLRRTFTYCKPLLVKPGRPPVELNRLDSKNWDATPDEVVDKIIQALNDVLPGMHGLVLLDQVDQPQTGVVTSRVLRAVERIQSNQPRPRILADSRRGLRGYPPVGFKMNQAELASMTGLEQPLSMNDLRAVVSRMARENGQPVFVTLAEKGILAGDPQGRVEHVEARPPHGPIDVVGAGDAVTANLMASLAAGASLRESLELANAAASSVVHQLGTTGTANVEQIGKLLTEDLTA